MKNIDLSDKGHDINLVCKPEHDLTDEDLKNKDVEGTNSNAPCEEDNKGLILAHSQHVQHQDALERIKCLFCGQLLYGARLREVMDPHLMSSFQESAGSPSQRLRAAVRKLKGITGRGVFPDQRGSPRKDKQVLFLQKCHWLEALDRRHRYGGNLKHYFEAWRGSDTFESFFYWLDEGDGRDVDLQIASRSNLEAHHVKYCTAIEREAFLTKTSHGKICYVLTGKPVEGKKIFVMGTRGHLYMADKIKGRFQHSSFLAGAAVTVAGSAEMSDGHFISLSAKSGHYRPMREDFVLFVKVLQEKGLCSKNLELLEGLVSSSSFGPKHGCNLSPNYFRKRVQ